MIPGPVAPAAATLFSEFKYWATATLNLSRDALHIHVGLALYLSLLLLARGRLGIGTVWLLVLALTLVGEVPDYLVLRQDGHVFDEWRHLHDVLNTMLWPSVLAVLGSVDDRWRRGRSDRSTKRWNRSADAEEGHPRSA